MLLSAASTIPLVHCIHLLSPLLCEGDQGTGSTVPQEPAFGEQRGLVSPQALCLSETTFPSVDCKVCPKDFKG